MVVSGTIHDRSALPGSRADRGEWGREVDNHEDPLRHLRADLRHARARRPADRVRFSVGRPARRRKHRSPGIQSRRGPERGGERLPGSRAAQVWPAARPREDARPDLGAAGRARSDRVARGSHRRPERGAEAARGSLQGVGLRRPPAHPGRTDHHAHPAGDRPALRVDALAQGARHGLGLRLAQARGGEGHLRPGDRPQGRGAGPRSAHRRNRAGGDGPLHGRARASRDLPAEEAGRGAGGAGGSWAELAGRVRRRVVHGQRGRDSWLRRSRRGGTDGGRGGADGLAVLVGGGAPRWRGRQGEERRPGSAAGPRLPFGGSSGIGRPHRLRHRGEHDARVPQGLHVLRLRRRPREGKRESADLAPALRHQGRRSGRPARVAVRREPAEGVAGEDARPRPARGDRRRAYTRGRRGRETGDLPLPLRAGRKGNRSHPDLERAGRDHRDVRPGAGHARRAHRRRARGRSGGGARDHVPGYRSSGGAERMSATLAFFQRLEKERYAAFAALAILSIASALLSPFFLQWQNLLNIVRQVSYTGIIALGMTFVIVSGGIDLSVGSMAAFVGSLAMIALNAASDAGLTQGTAVAGAIACAVLAGLACGLANGLLVTKGRIAPFIVTLGTMALFRSLSLYMANAGEFRSASSLFGELGSSAPLGIQLPAFILLGLAAALAFVFKRTRYGRYTRAVGSNSRVARYSAIDVDTTRLAAYTVTGLMVGVSAVLIAMRLNSVGSSTLGVNYELDAIAAVIIGGTSMSGGRGTVWGTVVGAITLGVINNMLNMVGISPYLQGTVKGLVIIGAVFIQRQRQ